MRDFSSIHHLGDETVHQYLDKLTDQTLRTKPITCIVTENLARDAKTLLKLAVGHNHKGVSSSATSRHLTATAKENLRRLFAFDHLAIERLYDFGALSRAQWLACISEEV